MSKNCIEGVGRVSYGDQKLPVLLPIINEANVKTAYSSPDDVKAADILVAAVVAEVISEADANLAFVLIDKLIAEITTALGLTPTPEEFAAQAAEGYSTWFAAYEEMQLKAATEAATTTTEQPAPPATEVPATEQPVTENLPAQPTTETGVAMQGASTHPLFATPEGQNFLADQLDIQAAEAAITAKKQQAFATFVRSAATKQTEVPA